jgi:hypothetical protein
MARVKHYVVCSAVSQNVHGVLLAAALASFRSVFESRGWIGAWESSSSHSPIVGAGFALTDRGDTRVRRVGGAGDPRQKGGSEITMSIGEAGPT